jgi:membrane protein implicated in regulation of membrane protease activity
VSTYSQIAWLPLTFGLSLLGLIAGFITWRRRGAGPGLRIVAWSLLPLAAYLIGVIELLWRFGTAIASFASSFVFSPKVWAGIIVAIVAVLLFVVSGRLRGRARRRSGGQAAPKAAGAGTGATATAAGKPGKAISTGKRQPAVVDDDVLGDAAEVLRRHGIR